MESFFNFVLESRNNGVGSYGIALPLVFPVHGNLASGIDLNLESMVILATPFDGSSKIEANSHLLEVGLALGKCFSPHKKNVLKLDSGSNKCLICEITIALKAPLSGAL